MVGRYPFSGRAGSVNITLYTFFTSCAIASRGDATWRYQGKAPRCLALPQWRIAIPWPEEPFHHILADGNNLEELRIEILCRCI